MNIGLVKLARVLLKRNPTLLNGVDVDGHLNDACALVCHNWAESVQSFYSDDVIDIQAGTRQHYVSTQGDASKLYLSLATVFEDTLYLKEFFNSDVDYRLATEAIRALNVIANEGLEIWTPEVIKSLYAYAEWHGKEDDSGVKDAWEEHYDEPMDLNSGKLLPSGWDDTLASSGFFPVGHKPTLTSTERSAYKRSADGRVVNLAKAIAKVFKLAETANLPNSNENQADKVEASFCFLWSEDDMLGDAMDEVLQDRWNCGEAIECQFEFEIDQRTPDEVIEQDVVYLEQLLAVQLAVGELRKAMVAFMK